MVTNIKDTIVLMREVAAAYNKISAPNKHHALQSLIDTIVDAAIA